MKIYYNRLSKEKQKEIKTMIMNTDKAGIIKKINIYYFLVIMSILVVFIDIYYHIYIHNNSVLNYLLDVIIIMSMLVFYYNLNKIKEKVLNDFVLELKKQGK